MFKFLAIFVVKVSVLRRFFTGQIGNDIIYYEFDSNIKNLGLKMSRYQSEVTNKFAGSPILSVSVTRLT